MTRQHMAGEQAVRDYSAGVVEAMIEARESLDVGHSVARQRNMRHRCAGEQRKQIAKLMRQCPWTRQDMRRTVR